MGPVSALPGLEGDKMRLICALRSSPRRRDHQPDPVAIVSIMPAARSIRLAGAALARAYSPVVIIPKTAALCLSAATRLT